METTMALRANYRHRLNNLRSFNARKKLKYCNGSSCRVSCLGGSYDKGATFEGSSCVSFLDVDPGLLNGKDIEVVLSQHI